MAAEKHYTIEKSSDGKSWFYHTWMWKNKKKGLKNTLDQGHGYNTAQGAKKGMQAACKAYYGSWEIIKELVVVIK